MRRVELKCSGMRGTFQIPLANEGSSPVPSPAPNACPPGRGPCERRLVALKGSPAVGFPANFSFCGHFLRGVFLLANLGPGKYSAAGGNDKQGQRRGWLRRAPGLRQAAPLSPLARHRSQARAGSPPPGSVSAGPAQACTPRELGRERLLERRLGASPGPGYPRPQQPCSPKNKLAAARPQGLCPIRVSGSPAPCPSDPQPASLPRRGTSQPALPGGPGWPGTSGSVPCGGASGPPGAPLEEGETQKPPEALPAPPSPAAATVEGRAAGPGRPPPAASRCARGCGGPAAPPRRAPSPRAAPAPLAPRAAGARAHLVLGPPPCFPLFCPKTRPEAPGHEGASWEIALPAAPGLGGGSPGRGRGGGPRGSGAGSSPRPRATRSPALSVSVTCPRSPPPPPPSRSCRAVGPAAAVCAPGLPPGAPGCKRGCPRDSRDPWLPGSAQGTRGHGGTGGATLSQICMNLKGARGADAHKGTRTTNTGEGTGLPDTNPPEEMVGRRGTRLSPCSRKPPTHT